MGDDELDPDNVDEERIRNHLPARTDDTAVERLRRTLDELDGISNECFIPIEAYDIGDVPFPPNPRAEDLADADLNCDNGYPSGYQLGHDEEAGQHTLFDGPHVTLTDAYVCVNSGAFIDDVTDWA
ncbi:hypothetical protein HAPG_00067 [Halorubrum phage GNf2]|nr:hypothetical protein HAPG_00067 [Halorubrum phage GNf2]